jgi:glycosyltransferase involved in cell wall biosynthesis
MHHQIELINNLKHEFPELQLHLYGFGKEKDKLLNLIKILSSKLYFLIKFNSLSFSLPKPYLFKRIST